MSKRDVVWVGVSLNAGDNLHCPASQINRAHSIIYRALSQQDISQTRIVTRFESGAESRSYTFGPGMGEVVDIYDATTARIGFGVKVRSVKQGEAKLERVIDWMSRMDLRLVITVWAWSPTRFPSHIVRRVSRDLPKRRT